MEITHHEKFRLRGFAFEEINNTVVHETYVPQLSLDIIDICEQNIGGHTELCTRLWHDLKVTAQRDIAHNNNIMIHMNNQQNRKLPP